jgi:FKBP-type peptidyl-prolyl cis-trans isomerase FkpA/FKBP-type peptidyl-prolyl cis-trans isomerase FklB
MKLQQVLTLCAIPLFALEIGCHRKPNLGNDKAKLSYAIGQNIAKNIKGQGLDVDPEVVGYSVTQGLKGEKAEVSEDDQRKAVTNLQHEAQAKMMAEAEQNKKSADEFLAKNKETKGVITTKSGLQYEVLTPGKGRKPTLKDVVTVHYTGTLTDGKKFDSSLDRGKPAEFPLNGIIKGWQEALQLMPEGSVYRLYIPPELGYGANPQPGIPPNSVLVFDVQLLKVGKSKK